MLSLLIALAWPVRKAILFEVVYRENFAFVWRALRRLGVPERDLADAAQDTFLVVHRRLGEFDYQCQMTTWLYAICFRVASDRRRKGNARHEVLSAAQGSTLGDLVDASTLGDPNEARVIEYRALLREALDAMPPEQRAVFVGFELQGLEGSEVALALSVPIATVHSRLRLARATLRRVVARAAARERFEPARRGGGS